MDEDFFQKNDLFNDLYYVTKGKEKCSPGHDYGPAIREYYLIHFIHQGKGEFHSNGIGYQLEKGQFFLIFPNHTNYYIADMDEPWEYSWIGFNGKSVESLLKIIGLTKNIPVGTIKEEAAIKYWVEKMIEKNPYELISRLKLQGYLYQIFANLIVENKDLSKLGHIKVNKNLEYTSQAIQYIQDNYHRTDFNISEISNNLALNPSYLTQVFKKTTTRTMYDYLIDYRTQKSRELLETTQEPIKNISEMVGYANTLSFTRAFKNKMNMTPSDYRRKKKERGFSYFQ